MTRPDTHGWEAHVAYDPALYGVDQVRVLLRRRAGGDLYETVRSVDNRTAVLHRYDPGTSAADDGEPWGLVLPVGVAEAIADAVRPGPSAAELAVLREALDVERRRVDRVVDTYIGNLVIGLGRPEHREVGG